MSHPFKGEDNQPFFFSNDWPDTFILPYEWVEPKSWKFISWLTVTHGVTSVDSEGES